MPEAKTILVFEDNKNIQVLLRVFLKKWGYEPVFAEDGTEAPRLAREHRPVLILMDYIMPGKDGVEACLDLRRAGFKTPVVMLTSKDVDEAKAVALRAGAAAYLIKPFNPAELQATIIPLLG